MLLSTTKTPHQWTYSRIPADFSGGYIEYLTLDAVEGAIQFAYYGLYDQLGANRILESSSEGQYHLKPIKNLLHQFVDRSYEINITHLYLQSILM